MFFFSHSSPIHVHVAPRPSTLPGHTATQTPLMVKRKVPDSELTPEELRRREAQRAQQQAAVAARERGEVFESTRRTTFPKRKPLEARKEAERILIRKSENAARRRTVQKAIKADRAKAPDVVVVPIYWKGEAKQMARVLLACSDVEKALETSKWKVMLDSGHKYTPGQKFAHWEHKGVKLRVEIGPREAERGECTVARTFAPGEPALRKQRVSVDSLLDVLAELHAMKNPGDEGGGGGSAVADAEEEANAEPGRAGRLRVARERAAQEGSRAWSAPGGGGGGGDDLDDDFLATGAGREDGDEDKHEDQAKAPSAKKSKTAGSTSASSAPKRKVVKF